MTLLDKLICLRSSDHPHTLGSVICVFRHIEFENLEYVDLLRIGRKAGITEDGSKQLALGDFLDHAFRNIRAKAGGQVAVVVGVDSAAVDFLGLVRQGKRQTLVNQAAEQQAEVGAVILDVGFKACERSLIVVIRYIVDVLQVGISQLENAETDAGVLLGHGAFGLDLIPGIADSSLPIEFFGDIPVLALRHTGAQYLTDRLVGFHDRRLLLIHVNSYASFPSTTSGESTCFSSSKLTTRLLPFPACCAHHPVRCDVVWEQCGSAVYVLRYKIR